MGGEQARSQRFTRERYHSNFSSRSSFHREEYKESQRWGVPPSFESNNLPAARLWLEVGKSDLKRAASNLAAGDFMWAAYAARMVRTQGSSSETRLKTSEKPLKLQKEISCSLLRSIWKSLKMTKNKKKNPLDFEKKKKKKKKKK